MKTKLLLWLAALFAGGGLSTVWASSYAGSESGPEAVNVYQKSGTIHSTMFDDFTNLELSGDVIIVHKVSGEATTIAMDDVANILWGDYVEHTPTDIENVSNQSFCVYHNGTHGVIRSTEAILHYAVFDALGRFICSSSPATDTHEIHFPTDSWANGLYLVYVETTAGKTSSKIIL